MRIYDLQDSLEKLIDNDDFQIEIIGEDRGWTTTVSKRVWSNELQRYTYDEIGGCTSPTFLGAYDFIASCVYKHGDFDD